MDPSTVRGLTNSQWVEQHLGVLLTGPTGIGKSWLGQALAQKACRDGYTVLYKPAAKLFRNLAQVRADGSLGKVLEFKAGSTTASPGRGCSARARR